MNTKVKKLKRLREVTRIRLGVMRDLYEALEGRDDLFEFVDSETTLKDALMAIDTMCNFLAVEGEKTK